jgi:hypothetical protein
MAPVFPVVELAIEKLVPLANWAEVCPTAVKLLWLRPELDDDIFSLLQPDTHTVMLPSSTNVFRLKFCIALI